jgi:hypothetical protein
MKNCDQGLYSACTMHVKVPGPKRMGIQSVVVAKVHDSTDHRRSSPYNLGHGSFT